jgi:hypothetical protein
MSYHRTPSCIARCCPAAVGDCCRCMLDWQLMGLLHATHGAWRQGVKNRRPPVYSLCLRRRPQDLSPQSADRPYSQKNSEIYIPSTFWCIYRRTDIFTHGTFFYRALSGRMTPRCHLVCCTFYLNFSRMQGPQRIVVDSSRCPHVMCLICPGMHTVTLH